MELKKISALSVAKISLIFGILIGLFGGIVIAVSSKALSAEEISAIPVAYQYLTGWKAILIMPLLYGIIYFLAGLIIPSLYNLIVRWTGGITFELNDSKRKK